MSKDLISEITTDTAQELLREVGWEAQLAGTKDQPQVVSSVAGINFNIRFGTPAQGKAGWTDFTISAPFTVDEEVSPVVGAFWNRRNRFARVYRTQDQLILDMDVVLAGGVTRAHVKYLLAVWSDVARLFLSHLRADHAVLTRYQAAGRKEQAKGVAAFTGLASGDRSRTNANAAGQRSTGTGQTNGKAPGLDGRVHVSGSS